MGEVKSASATVEPVDNRSVSTIESVDILIDKLEDREYSIGDVYPTAVYVEFEDASEIWPRSQELIAELKDLGFTVEPLSSSSGLRQSVNHVMVDAFFDPVRQKAGVTVSGIHEDFEF